MDTVASLLLGVILFCVASIWCGVANSVQEFILARAGQGLGAALLVTGSLALLGASFDERDRVKAIGTWSGATAIAAALGIVLGGWLIIICHGGSTVKNNLHKS